MTCLAFKMQSYIVKTMEEKGIDHCAHLKNTGLFLF